MKYDDLNSKHSNVKISILYNDSNWIQLWYSIVPKKSYNLSNQLRIIENEENLIFSKYKVDRESIVFKRFFSSDLVNHKDDICHYKSNQETDYCLSVVEQPPASNVKVAMLGLCMYNVRSKIRYENMLFVETDDRLKHIFINNLCDKNSTATTSAESQIWNIFNTLNLKLSKYDLTIPNNVHRTWLYTPCIDIDYEGIVMGRNTFFEEIGLNGNTHTIASTGVEGLTESNSSRVFMDVYALEGVKQEDIRYIDVPENMCPTHHYGVFFERATAIKLNNIDFLFISGTASINKHGDVLHLNNVKKQTERSIENIIAVLETADFSEQDITSIIVYIRDVTDYESVKGVVEKHFKSQPTVYVKASICRPEWLMEIELTAAKNLAVYE